MTHPVDGAAADGRAGVDPAILHVDMDCFFAAVEVLDDPSLLGKPVIVGGTGRRGVVAAASYEARAYGVYSATPTGRARRLCPHGVFLHGRFARYEEVSRAIRRIFDDCTPLVEPLSLDEAFLDVRGARRLLGTGEQVAHHIRGRIANELGLACTVGVATAKFLAKMASKAGKPTATRRGVVPGPGVFVVPSGGELEFLHPHPVGALWGVGPATQAKLERLGIATIGDLAAVPLAALTSSLGPAAARHLHDLAQGIDARRVEPDRETKSIGHEETYPTDLTDPERLRAEVVRMADAVATRLREHGWTARTVTLKVRFPDFRTITRRTTLPSPTDTAHEVAAVAASLLVPVHDEIADEGGVRLLGVTVSGLAEAEAHQLSLEDAVAWTEAERAVDAVRRRFGAAAVGSGAVLDRGGGGLRPKRRGDQQWGPAAPAPPGPPGGGRPGAGGSPEAGDA